MKNVTITVEDSVLEWARVEAARRNTSVSRMLGEFMREMQRRDDVYERAYQEWRNEPRTWRSDGSPYPKRDEIYDRGRLK
ncbi:CopG family transcriptional regulator [Ottowia testudinis]|uniref:CopG family transcriptional regulator n=1 Tax=Ottowia testudinis TaxID=2816950 RepID=A0A975CGL4_9BURK|nr:CopG family transcriptional regulator [Ottowia testudinis]QTD46073.1 CopG family transcriptional regulator [Ottowia testudinis]